MIKIVIKWIFFVKYVIYLSNPRANKKNSKSNARKKIKKCKHIELSIEFRNIDDVDRIFHSNITEHNKKYDYYLIKCEFNLVFNDSQYNPYVTSNLSDNKTMISRQTFLENVIEDF